MSRAVPDVNEKAEGLLESFWIWRMENYPEFATFSGCHEFDDKLEIYNIDAFHQRKASCRKCLEECQELLKSSSLKRGRREDLEYLHDYLVAYIKGMDARGHYFAINSMEGPHIEFKELIKSMKSETIEDCYKILCRYQALPVQLTQMIDWMKDAIKLKMTFHKISVGLMLEQIDYSNELKMFQEEPENCDFYKPFLNLPDSICAEKKKSILLEAVESITHNIFPAFNMLREFIENEYFPSTRSEIGVSSMPYGGDRYQKCLDSYLSYHLTPENICLIALTEMKRIEKEMLQVIESLDVKMTLTEFYTKIKTDDSLYYKDSEELISSLQNLLKDKILPLLLGNVVEEIPEDEIEIRPVPDTRDLNPAAYYSAGNLDGSRPGIFYLDSKEIGSLPKYEIVSLALHEIVPGHHLQASYLNKCENIAAFRKIIEDRKYSETPSRFQLHAAFIEGWGLYCSTLGFELGFYDDPYIKFGHLSRELHHTAMLVVDTGIHAFNWTIEKAAEYMLGYSAETLEQIIKEIVQIVTWPGQVCACKIGQLKISNLREETERLLGSEFNLPEFHDVLLKSCGPLPIVQEKVLDYVKRKKDKHPRWLITL